jgi:hypothetical protein
MIQKCNLYNVMDFIGVKYKLQVSKNKLLRKTSEPIRVVKYSKWAV